jgi:hypothetical protein
LLYLQSLLAEDGRWGVMQAQRWDAFLDWLSGEQGSCSLSAPAVAAAAVVAADAHRLLSSAATLVPQPPVLQTMGC